MAAGNSVIGALRVELGLDSAQFTNGLKKAESGLAGFGKAAGAGLAAVGVAAAAAAAAMGIAVKGAIDHADALGKAAQKAGVTTEALSRLAYAASYSDVSLDGTTAALTKLSKTMAEAAQNTKGTAASAFAALGISVKDASGKLRDSDDVFTDVADRFSKLADGSTKTAIAMALFGKSGADLIPLLNGGATEIRRFSDEADRLGVTISTQTGKQAADFNDTLAKVGQILQGVANKVAVAALPALQNLASTLASPEFAKAAEWLAKTIVAGLDFVIDKVTAAINVIGDLSTQIHNAFASASQVAGDMTDDQVKAEIQKWQANLEEQKKIGYQIGIGRAEQEIAGYEAVLARRKTTDTIGSGAGAFGDLQNMFAPPSTGGSNISLDKFTSGTFGKTQETIDPFAARIEELSDVLTKSHDPFQQLQDDLTDLGTMFANGRITAEQYGLAVQKTNLNAVASFADMAAGVSGALGNLFKDNKAFAVSNAILQGLSGVAYALGSSAPPWNFINAAAVGIEAAANVANILSTNANSTSMPSASSGGGAAAGAAGASSAVNITFRGSGSFNIDDVFRQATQQIADGGLGDFVRVVRAP